MAGRRGPAPQPAKVKKAKGNPGKRPILTDQIEAEAELAGADGADLRDGDSVGAGGVSSGFPSMEPPEWLNEDGLVVWDRIAPRLQSMKILQHIDADTFGRYCQNFGRWVRLQKRLDKEGETYESETAHGKYIKANPAFMMASRLDRELMMQEQNFALNPADRQRLFAARAAAAGAGGADLFGATGGAGGGDKQNENPGDRATGPIGMLN